MEGVKASRKAHSGVLTRARNKLDIIPFEHPDEVKRIKLTDVKAILKTINTTEAGFSASMEEAQDFAPADEDELANFQEEELEVAEAFHERLHLTRTLGEQILACKTIHTGVTTFRTRLDALQNSLDAEPDRDHSTSLTRLQTLLYSLREQWEETDLSTEHNLQSDLDRCEVLLSHKAGAVSAARSRSTPPTPPLSSTLASITSTGAAANYSKLPMIKVPTFSGDIMGWSTFWATFESTVDSRLELNSSQKLNYLRQAIKDPALQLLMNSPLEGPDTYQDLVDELKDRFQKKKEIHQAVVKTITTIFSPKYTRADLRLFYDTLKTSITNLKSTSHYDIESFLSSLAYSILPNKLQILWDQATKAQKGVLPITELLAFVKDHAETLPASATHPAEKSAPAKKKEQPVKGRNSVHTTTTTAPAATSARPPVPYKWDCVICKPEKHPLHVCSRWAELALASKLALIETHTLCSNCLHKGHTTEACRSKYRCSNCKQKHHTSIHQQAASTIVNHSFPNCHQVPDALMTTAQLLLIGPNGEEVKARALIDSGAGISMVTQQVAQLLNLPLEPAKLRLTVAQGEVTKPLKYLTQLQISPLDNRSLKMPCHPAVATIVTANLPSQPVPSVTDLPHLLGLQLADETYNLPGPIDILLGADMASSIVSPRLPRQGKPTEPMAQATKFGWTISGPVPGFGRDPDSASILHHLPLIQTEPTCPSEPQLETLLTAILLEEEGTRDATPTQLDQQVEKHYSDNVSYSNTDQRYTVCLPKKNCISDLGKSRPQAVSRFYTNEKSIQHKGIGTQFQEVIKTYLELGHAERVPPEDHPPAASFWLPMHAVFKEASTSTKLRVVFDGSAATTTGLSLNHALYVGPTLQATLSEILIRFRRHPVALNADISKMYREVQLSPPDRDLHRFVWRKNTDSELHDYRMTRVTFGVSASPFLAVRTLHQTAEDHGEGYPEATQHIQGSFYVDDYLGGADSPEDAIRLFGEIREILQKGGFQLRKWRSSSTEVLSQIPKDLQESDPVKQSTAINPATQSKALGLLWDSSFDVMSPAIYSNSASSPTKRGLTSAIFKTYDVLGWIAPTILQMKLLIQELWTIGAGWDDAAPEAAWQTYQEWKDELPILTNKRINRCYTEKGYDTVSLHGFADASMKAYGAVVYCRATYPTHEPTISLIASKTKLAKKPKKTSKKKLAEQSKENTEQSKENTGSEKPEDTTPDSIHRLELCAALLLAKLISKLGKLLDIPAENWVAWSDSSTVLAWLDGNSRSQPIYEANRVKQTLELTTPSMWHYVPTLTNPADCASRGLSPAALFHHDLWWEGPPWLKEDPYTLPNQPPRKPLPDARPPINVVVPYFSVAGDISSRPHQYPHLIAIAAWCLRFMKRVKEGRPSPDTRTKQLTGSERRMAEQWLLKEAQKRSFLKEVNLLKKKKLVGKDSRLRTLNPYLDENDLLRLGGRISSSARPTTISQPIITDARDILMENYYNYLHELLCHCGPSLLLAYSGSRFHIIGARRLSRRLCSKCVTCRRCKPRTQKQFMAELPAPRVNASPPFTNCGMDFAGPFTLKLGRVRQPVLVEAHICVFVCLATRAVHLEVVSEESTPAFMAALQRFVCRRGCPQHLYSDNGGNFVGARNKLTKLYKFLNSQESDEDIKHFLSTHHPVQWHNIPAYSPHMGGLWEAAVKQMKKHLLRVMGVRRFTFEELSTIACRIEACLNNRPLLPLTSHSMDGVTALTPGHFLLNKATTVYPEDPTPLTRMDLKQKWDLCQAVVQQWWTRWHKEYLNALQARTKWQTTSTNLRVGDVVAIRPRGKFVPSHWPIGLIVNTLPGKDDRVRVVNIKTKAGTLQRAVTQLALIYRPGEEDDQDQEQQPQPGPQSLFRQEATEA